MMFKTLVSTTAAIAALVSCAAASMAPTYPSPGTIWTTGETYTLTWADDSTAPDFASGWTDFKIQFMTGSNFNQTALATVASGLDATKVTSYTWTAPEVNPNSAVYFFMYTNAAGVSAWTTRFGIIAKAGDILTPEVEKTQPDGGAIPWGNGNLITAAGSGGVSSSAAPAPAVASDVSNSSVAPAASSAAVSDALPADSAAPATESDASSKADAAKEKVTVDSGVEALRAPLAQVGLAIVAVAAVALA